jgi:gluconate 2-dehydrogenase gamma chain
VQALASSPAEALTYILNHARRARGTSPPQGDRRSESDERRSLSFGAAGPRIVDLMSDRQMRDQARGPLDRPRLSRRRLLGGGAVALGGAIAAGGLARTGDDEQPRPRVSSAAAPRLRVLNAAEAATLGAMADRVFPPDDDGPGGAAIGVVTYLDGQLAGDWGGGAGLYRHGPFPEPAAAGQGYQLPLTPRELYKHALERIEEHVKKRHAGRALPALAPEQQDDVLAALEAGKVDLELAHGPNGFTSADFFTIFLANVKEGLFADPIHGGNRDADGWRWIGYPGDPMAYGDSYFGLFSSWQTPYDVEPRGLAAHGPTPDWQNG